MSNRERYLCMISTCSWYYERDSGPTSAELERALMFGPADASLDRAARTNAILREHFEMSHTLEEWVVEIGRERQRAETAERELARQRKANRDIAKQCMQAMEQATTAKRELAELRERIGEAKVEWYVRWPAAGGDYHYELCLDEADARESVPDGDEVCEVVSRVVGEWKAADDG